MQDNNTKTKANVTGLKLVEVHRKQILTSTLVISANVERDHESVIKLARKYEKDLLEVGLVRFEIRLNTQGSPTEYAFLDDYAAILLMTHMRSTGKIAEFKKRLVQEFKRMRKMLSDPDRKEALQYKRDTAKPMTDMLTFIRETVGKKTSGMPHCTNEHLFCNRALTGKYEPIDEANDLDAYDAKLLGVIRQHNTLLMTRHLKQSDRKKLMDEFVANYRYKNPKQEFLEAAS
jgi:phage regulator Rha-like protein